MACIMQFLYFWICPMIHLHVWFWWPILHCVFAFYKLAMVLVPSSNHTLILEALGNVRSSCLSTKVLYVINYVLCIIKLCEPTTASEKNQGSNVIFKRISWAKASQYRTSRTTKTYMWMELKTQLYFEDQ